VLADGAMLVLADSMAGLPPSDSCWVEVCQKKKYRQLNFVR
jgi:hypothetical protein